MQSQTFQTATENCDATGVHETLAALSGAFSGEDLTTAARREGLSPAILSPAAAPEFLSSVWTQLIDQMARGLFRRKGRHVLIIGQQGVGKTTLVRELARQAAAGVIPFLQGKQFLRIDCQDVAPEESRRCFASLMGAVSEAQDLILCLDDLGVLVRTDGGPSNKSLLRQALRNPQLQIIGILSQWEFDELLAGDAGVLDLCTIVSVPEPGEELSLAILRQAAARLEADFSIAIDPQAIDKSVRLSAKYIWNERLPQKAIRILERACEEIDYERSQLGRERACVTGEDVIRLVSELSRVPAETLAGDIDETDYEQVLGASVVGQEYAVRAVATELRLIRA
jgi:ATP-dependent Clp protease ATP-binding subunit ClpA